MTQDIQVFDKLKAEISLFVDPCLKVQVADETTCSIALDSAKQIKQFAKAVEDRRKELVGPLNEQVKKINGYAKLISQPLEEAETHLKRQLSVWNDVLEDRRLAEMKKAEEARKKAEEEARLKAEADLREAEELAMFMGKDEAKKAEIIAQAESERAIAEVNQSHASNVRQLNTMKVSGSKKVWKFEVTDLSLIPREFLIVDESAIRRAILAGQVEIPGIRAFQETQIAIGR